ncbi:prolyl-tRNA synthetase associated domain-containing protein [Serpentinicella sp. ANB-PHB4]|nr:prolyl-tRNA synthetase associated domain-containing protein [Serpentinicella sp. ANB-PHB4]MDR5659682.1 prolyl-tRNA synthetase associated domain-containing protein [Serpentinicella sp. ANB-PHB4]
MSEEQSVKVYNILDQLNIDYIKYEHPPAHTMEIIKELNIDTEEIHCKNLFLRNSSGKIHYLLMVEGSKQPNLKQLAKQIGSTRLSFASKERMEKHLGLKPGAVSPLGLINDEERKVQVLIDKDLIEIEKITFHPNVNTASVTMDYKDFEKFLEWRGNKLSIVEI